MKAARKHCTVTLRMNGKSSATSSSCSAQNNQVLSRAAKRRSKPGRASRVLHHRPSGRNRGTAEDNSDARLTMCAARRSCACSDAIQSLSFPSARARVRPRSLGLREIDGRALRDHANERTASLAESSRDGRFLRGRTHGAAARAGLRSRHSRERAIGEIVRADRRDPIVRADNGARAEMTEASSA